MRPIVVTAGPLAAAAPTAVCASQTPAAAGPLTINGALASGGVANLGTAQRLAITSASNDSATSLTITGTGWSGQTWSETITCPNATTVYTVLDYLTVTSIVASGAATGPLTVGTGQVGASPWVRLDDWSMGPSVVQQDVTGTVNVTAQTSQDDPNSAWNPVAPASMTWLSLSTLTSATASAAVSLLPGYGWIRLVLNSGSGSATMTVTQSGAATF